MNPEFMTLVQLWMHQTSEWKAALGDVCSAPCCFHSPQQTGFRVTQQFVGKCGMNEWRSGNRPIDAIFTCSLSDGGIQTEAVRPALINYYLTRWRRCLLLLETSLLFNALMFHWSPTGMFWKVPLGLWIIPQSWIMETAWTRKLLIQPHFKSWFLLLKAATRQPATMTTSRKDDGFK